MLDARTSSPGKFGLPDPAAPGERLDGKTNKQAGGERGREGGWGAAVRLPRVVGDVWAGHKGSGKAGMPWSSFLSCSQASRGAAGFSKIQEPAQEDLGKAALCP